MRAPEVSGGARVRELARGASPKPFVEVAWRINAGDPHWVAPLRLSVATALDRRKHPFHRHAEVAYFVAERGGELVGRVAAIVNHLHNEVHEERTGFFGLFECEDDADTAAALAAAAGDWLRERGMERVRGPMNFSTNEEVSSPGVLVEGFERRPTIMMSHNPPYYAPLLETIGFRPVKDLLAFWFDDPRPPERAVRSAERILTRERATLRPLNLRRLKDEIAIIRQIYNAAWSRNWGFVPMTDAEFDHLASEFRPIVDPQLCLIAEADGEPAGFSLALPDLNQALRHLRNGRLFPFGLPKLLWHKRRIRGLRVITLGLTPRFRRSGLGAAFYLRTWQVGVARGYRHAEASWILEDNHHIRRPLERMGGRVHRRYRIFEREL